MDKKIKQFYCVMAVLTVFICGVVVWGMFYFYNTYFKTYQMASNITVIPNKVFFKDDLTVGFKCNPGQYLIKIGTKENFLPFDVTINEDGWRATGNYDKPVKGKEIWMFGCSYTFGWSISDNETYPWLLQEKLQDSYNVYNYAGNGYGNVHGLNQLKFLLKEGKRDELTGVIAVFNYNRFHLKRNVAAYSHLASFSNIKGLVIHYPKAYLDEKEQLHISVNPFFLKPAPDPDDSYMEKVTRLIFDDIYNICMENDIVPVVVYQQEEANDTVIEYCRNKGFYIIDITVDNIGNSKYNNKPYDIHPNASAHAIYFDKIYAGLLGNKLIAE